MAPVEIKPDTTLPYAVGGDEKGGCLMVFGKPEAEKVALLCAGFPDDHTKFLPLASRLSKECDCLAGVMCCPGFDDRPPEKPWTSHPKDGYAFDEWVNAAREATKVLRGYSTYSQAKFTGIFHDYGVLLGLMYTNRTLHDTTAPRYLVPDQVVLFDVLTGADPKTPGLESIVEPKKSVGSKLYHSVVTYTYRIILSKAYLLQRYVAGSIALVYVGLSFALLGMLGLKPTRAVDDQMLQDYPIKDPYRVVYMAYPYWMVLKSMVQGTIRKDLYGAALPRDLKTVPILYLYGKDKNIHFHPDNALMLLEEEAKQKRSKSSAIGIDKAGHYLYLQQPDACFEHVKKFLED